MTTLKGPADAISQLRCTEGHKGMSLQYGNLYVHRRSNGEYYCVVDQVDTTDNHLEEQEVVKLMRMIQDLRSINGEVQP
jgi:hypothetical protein